ncbi:hypothetical protein [Tuwongella immobilis]|uniref:Uncharacterized protein n=1 Tax=Tuwongella immobilis TaxID=692036 RepID=A0A6C2YVE8_9BACT|nr:hypothetical protein [Tuwongella immobilis]VIP05347.1 unnamed protein product [Tuwongella immobilis]VTS08050.1 unnamed protein product [Tuwongella immobilis]
MSFRDALNNEMREAGRGVAANLEGRAGDYQRLDNGPVQSQAPAQASQTTGQEQDVNQARQTANEKQQEHHTAAHADYDAQREVAAAEQQAAAQESQAEKDGPEYGG